MMRFLAFCSIARFAPIVMSLRLVTSPKQTIELLRTLGGRHSAALEQMVESSGASRGEAREGTWTRNRP